MEKERVEKLNEILKKKTEKELEDLKNETGDDA